MLDDAPWTVIGMLAVILLHGLLELWESRNEGKVEV